MLLRSTAASALPVSFLHQPPYGPPHPQQFPADSVRLCLCWPHLRALLLLWLASRSVVLLPYFMFGPSSDLRTTMPSADFWRFLPASLNAGSTMANRQISPGIAHSPSRLCLSDLRRSVPCKNRASHLLACSPRYSASIRFLFVRPAFCLQLPSDSASRRTPLLFG